MGLMLSRLMGWCWALKWLGADRGGLCRYSRYVLFVVMASLATVIKRDLSGMGKWLFMGVLVLLLGSVNRVIFLWVRPPACWRSRTAIGIAISAYMTYDIKPMR